MTIKVDKVHPAWPEHARCHCPSCSGGLVIDDGSDYYDLVGKQENSDEWDGECPHCGAEIVVKLERIERVTAKISDKGEAK